MKAECHSIHAKLRDPSDFSILNKKGGENPSSSSSSSSVPSSNLLGNFLRFLFDVEQFVFYLAVDSEDRFFFFAFFFFLFFFSVFFFFFFFFFLKIKFSFLSF